MSRDEEDPPIQDLIEDKIEEITDEVEDDEELREELEDLFDDLVGEFREGLAENMDETLQEHREEMDGFRDRLYETWAEPIDLFELYTILCQEIGQLYSHERREDAMSEEDLVHLALVKLHGRACLISREILALIKFGFADAAHARWRSIHEVAVVAEFIRQTGQETAKRFLLHKTVDNYHQALAYRNNDDIDDEPFTEEQFEQVKSLRSDLIDNFGQEFDGIWGWASHVIDSGRFREIEEEIGFGHHRPYYVHASKTNIHSGSKGTFDQLNTIYQDDYSYGNIAGPTNFGFTLPATHTARSLYQTTMSLVLHRPNEEYLIQLMAAARYLDDVEKSFPEVRSEIIERDQKKWDEYLDERKADIEENLDEFIEEYEDFTPPIVKIDLDDFDVHVGGEDS